MALSEAEWHQILVDYRDGVPLVVIVREYELTHPPEVEVYASQFHEKYQIRILKERVRAEFNRVSIVGLKTYDQMATFVEVVGVCMRHKWIDDGEWEAIRVQLKNWVDGKGIVGICDRQKQEEAEGRLMAIARGLSRRVFQDVTYVN